MYIQKNERAGKGFHGAELPLGCLYGRDNKSPFIWEMYVDAEDSLNEWLPLYRWNPQTGWATAPVWEKSITTRLLLLKAEEMYCEMIPIQRCGVYRNALAQVTNANIKKKRNVTVYTKSPFKSWKPSKRDGYYLASAMR